MELEPTTSPSRQLRRVDPLLASQRQAYREAMLLAVARAYVMVDAKAHLKQGWVELVWDNEGELPPTECQMAYAGAPKTAIARLRQGKLGIEDKLGCWTGDLFLGLKLSRGLAEKEPGHFRIDTKLHPELVKDISDWVLAGRLGSSDRQGRRRLVGCMAATHLPADDRQGAGVIAGLFAGARLTEIGGEHWVELPDEEDVKRLLDAWTIPQFPSRRIQRRNYIKISPFFAALVADLMPEHCRQRILGIKKPAMCPLLPILYWELAFGPRMKCQRILPFADALPFGCSRRTFFRRGWRRRELHRMAVLQHGILSTDGRLKGRMEKWFMERQRERSEPLKVS